MLALFDSRETHATRILHLYRCDKVHFYIAITFCTYDDAAALVECGWASSVNTAKIFLPAANAFGDVLLITPHSLRVREVNSAYQDPSLPVDISHS